MVCVGVAGAIIRICFHVGVYAFCFGNIDTLAGLAVRAFSTLHLQVEISASLVLKLFHCDLVTTVPVAYFVYFRDSFELEGRNLSNFLLHANYEDIVHVVWVRLSVLFLD